MANNRDEMGSEIKSAKSKMIDRIVFVALSLGAVIPFFPLNFSLLNENADREEVKPPITSTGAATIKIIRFSFR